MVVDTFWLSVGGGVLVGIFCVVVGGVGYILDGGGWWWIYFGW